MRFYDALQQDPSVLKKKIREAESPKEKRKLAAAMTARSFLIVLFAIMMISPAAPLFGQENSAMAVAMFCIFLGLRFVDFGCCIRDGLLTLAAAFLLLLLAPCAAAQVGFLLAAVIHCTAFFTILFLTSRRPEMGNAGLYTFAYIYLSGDPVSGLLLGKRALLTLVGYVLCAVILFVKHRKKNPSIRLWDQVKQFRITDKTTQWHLQLALGVGLPLALGSALHLPRAMWAAFACGSILGNFSAAPADVRPRLVQRLLGTLIGSAIYFLGCMLLPESLRPIFGPLGGICLGFCTQYRYKTASNCLGALFMATGLYGVEKSVFLRIGHNLVGVVFGYVFLVLYQKVMDRCFNRRTSDDMEIASV